MRSHQLTGEHLLGQSHLVDWSLSASHVRRYEPDRSDIAYITDIDPVTGISTPVAWFGGPRSATRTFSDLDETSYEGRGQLPPAPRLRQPAHGGQGRRAVPRG